MCAFYHPKVTKEDRDMELGLIQFAPEYHEDRLKDFLSKNDADWLWENEDIGVSDDEDIQWEYFTGADKKPNKPDTLYDKYSKREIVNEEDKLLIFTTARKAWIPHQIGIKKMSKVGFNKTFSIPEDVVGWERQNRREMLQEKLDIATIPWQDYEVSK